MGEVIKSVDRLSRRRALLRGLACAAGAATVLPAGAVLRSAPPLRISLANYGGVPGASSSTLINAFNSAYAALKANGGGTLVIPPGSYHLGSYGSNSYATNAIGLSNVLISGYGATLSITTTSSSVPAILHFQNCNNINIAGLSFTDPGTDLNINWKGAICVQADCTVACDGFKLVDCNANRVVALFKAYGQGGSGNYLLTNLDIHGTVTDSYYGVNVNYTGRNSKCNLTTHGVRRAFIAYGAQNWNITVDHTPSESARSNSLVELANDANGDVADVIVNVAVRGALHCHTAIVGFQQQGPLSATPVIRNVKANVVVQNATSTPGAALFWFMHDAGSGVLEQTNRRWTDIELDGSMDTMSAMLFALRTKKIVCSATNSTAPGNSVRIAQALLSYRQTLRGLPAYFTMATGNEVRNGRPFAG